MRRKLMMDQLRGNMDPDLKPDTAQRKEIDAILAHPSDILSHEQKDLLWLFGCVCDLTTAIARMARYDLKYILMIEDAIFDCYCFILC